MRDSTKNYKKADNSVSHAESRKCRKRLIMIRLTKTFGKWIKKTVLLNTSQVVTMYKP